MPDFRRRRGETVSEWAARLRREDASRLTPGKLDELTLRLVQAALASKSAAARVDSNSAAILRCKKAVLALSAEERRWLARWMEDGLAG